HVDGVMMGRAAYQEPWQLLAVDPEFFGEAARHASVRDAACAFVPYIERELQKGVRLHSITRHLLGLFRAVPGARAFRRHLATHAVKAHAGADVLIQALAVVLERAAELSHIAASLRHYADSCFWGIRAARSPCSRSGLRAPAFSSAFSPGCSALAVAQLSSRS